MADISFIILSTSHFLGAKYVHFQWNHLPLFPLEGKIAIIRRDLWKKSYYHNKSNISIFTRQKNKTVFTAIFMTTVIIMKKQNV